VIRVKGSHEAGIVLGVGWIAQKGELKEKSYMKCLKQRPGVQEPTEDRDPADKISKLIRSKADARQVCEWLAKYGDSCGSLMPGVFINLRLTIAKWDGPQPADMLPTIDRIMDHLLSVAALFSEQEGEICPFFIEAFIMFRALSYAALAQCERRLARQRKTPRTRCLSS
jgi:hypothetical protein